MINCLREAAIIVVKKQPFNSQQVNGWQVIRCRAWLVAKEWISPISVDISGRCRSDSS